MSRRMSVRYFVAIVAAVALLSLCGTVVEAAHDMGNDCYLCHTMSAARVLPDTRSITPDRATGTAVDNTMPLRCDYCHVDFQTRFTGGNVSGHPVRIISGSTTSVQVPGSVSPPTAKVLDCRECHQGNQKLGGYVPDLAPLYYGSNGIGTGGYPDHDLLGTQNNSTAGDPPHLGTFPDNVNRTYNKVPTATAALNTNFDLCFACHNNSGKTTGTKNIQADYQAGGHYFKTGSTGAWTFNAGDRIPCSDCHASHSSATNKFNFAPDNATFSGPVQTGKLTNRAICLACHDGYALANSTVTVRGRLPTRRTTTVPEHGGATGSGSTTPCSDCHNPHNPPAGGNNCLDCHRTGGTVQARHRMADLEFPVDGTWNAGAGEDTLAVQVSGHKGVVYNPVDNYATKATNECKKCHGLNHPTDAAKVQMADGATVYPTGFVYGLAYNKGSGVWSANGASFADGNGNNIIDGNEFCLSCHDGEDALDITNKGNILIGGVPPPKVWFPSGGQSTGHDRESGSNYPVSGHAPAQQLCTSCHKYHTSDRQQLFPGNVGPFGAGNAYTYAMPSWAGTTTAWQAPKTATGVFPSNAGKMVIGSRDANLISYVDRSNPASGKGFGTAGTDNVTFDGLCDACHRDAATVTAGTLNAAHTHEGNGVSPSTNTFLKDCTECHNPHGGGGGATPNISMIRQTVGRDNTTQNAVVFTARTGANSFDESDGAAEANADDLCATCHNNPAIQHNYRTETTAGNHNQGTNCIDCHSHGSGFAASGCEGCHTRVDANGGYDPDGTGPKPPAPNVMTTPDNSYSYWTQSGHGKWANNTSIPIQYRPTCVACHDIGKPVGTHLDFTRNTADSQSTYNSNTFHLQEAVNGFQTFVPGGDSTQATFDNNFCWNSCHKPRGAVKDHRHTKNAGGVALFGRKGTYADAYSRPYPPDTTIGSPNYGKPAGGKVYSDSSLTTGAPTSGSWFAPCVACHDPHGTATTDLGSPGSTNKMVRGNWKTTAGSAFCDMCHK